MVIYRYLFWTELPSICSVNSIYIKLWLGAQPYQALCYGKSLSYKYSFNMHLLNAYSKVNFSLPSQQGNSWNLSFFLKKKKNNGGTIDMRHSISSNMQYSVNCSCHAGQDVPMTCVFCDWPFVPFWLSSLVLPTPHLLPLAMLICYPYVWACFLFLFCFRFRI